MARRRFFVDEVHAGHARIQGNDAHHLTRVLRVAVGQKFEISDNRHVYLAEVETARKDVVDFSILERVELVPPAVRITLFASLIRFERFELMIEKTTELGVEAIVPVVAERSEKGLDRATAQRLPRWRRIAREASEQSRRARLPVIESRVGLSAALRHECAYRYVLEEAEAPPILSVLPVERGAQESVALLAGPEGGWTDRERAEIAGAGWQPVSLGGSILKTETAAIAGVAVLTAAWQINSSPESNAKLP